MANPDRRMVVVPNIRRDSRGGSASATEGESSRRLRSRMMLSIGLRLRSNDIVSAYTRVRPAEPLNTGWQTATGQDEQDIGIRSTRGNIVERLTK